MCQESKNHCGSSVPHPHADFVLLCPIIERHVRIVFRHHLASEIEEAVAEAVGAAFVSYLRLKASGKDPVRDFPSAMATFAALHVKNDRHVGGRSSSRDVLSARAQRTRGFRLESLNVARHTCIENLSGRAHGYRRYEEIEELFRGNTRTPVVDQAAFRVDFPSFLRSLSERDRDLAWYLGLGHSAIDAAKRFGISAGRVTQLRQQWQREWMLSQGEFFDTSDNTASAVSD